MHESNHQYTSIYSPWDSQQVTMQVEIVDDDIVWYIYVV